MIYDSSFVGDACFSIECVMMVLCSDTKSLEACISASEQLVVVL